MQSKLVTYFNKQEISSYESQLQRQVMNIFARYYDNIQKEKMINTMSVDAYITLNEKEAFILQVDGPTHYLHDEKGTPTASQKQCFRDTLLQIATQKPIIVVAYDQWQQQKSPSECYTYLQSVLADKQLALPAKPLPQTSWRDRHQFRH